MKEGKYKWNKLDKIFLNISTLRDCFFIITFQLRATNCLSPRVSYLLLSTTLVIRRILNEYSTILGFFFKFLVLPTPHVLRYSTRKDRNCKQKCSKGRKSGFRINDLWFAASWVKVKLRINTRYLVYLLS